MRPLKGLRCPRWQLQKDRERVSEALYARPKKTKKLLWIKISKSFSAVAKITIKLSNLFPTTYKSKKAFFALVTVKTKFRRKIDEIHNMRAVLAKAQPEI